MEVPPPPLIPPPPPPLFPKCSSHIGAMGTGDTTAETGARDEETLKKRGERVEERRRREMRGRGGGGVERYHLTLSREILSQCGGTVVVGGGFALERKIGMNISEVGGEGASRD